MDLTNTVNAGANLLTAMQVNRWLKAKAHTKRCSGINNIAWEKYHEMADEPNDVVDSE